MLSYIFAASALLAGSAIAAPACTPTPAPSVYQIKDFYSRKPDGKDITALGFNIAATNGGTLDFTCVAYDPATNAAAANFEDGKVYFCGKDSTFSFSYSEKEGDFNKNKLYLWQSITADNTIQGVVTLPEPYCHAGGAGQNDQACLIPAAVGNITIEMTSA